MNTNRLSLQLDFDKVDKDKPAIVDCANVYFENHMVTREERALAMHRDGLYRGCTLWFTGLSGAGKTTLSFKLEAALNRLGYSSYSLDGDNVRHGLCKNLGFKKDDRTENIRRVAEVCKLFADMGAISLASFISPFRKDREEARKIHEKEGIRFFEIYVNTPIDVCEARDPKNHYKKARAGELKGFTGVDSVYEMPLNPDVVLNAGSDPAAVSIKKLIDFLADKKIIPSSQGFELGGQRIKELFMVGEEEKIRFFQKSQNGRPGIDITLVDLQWIQVLSEGWATPLTGFMRERQYLQCLHHGQIFDMQKDFPKPKESRGHRILNLNEAFSKLVANQPKSSVKPVVDPLNQSIPIVLPITDQQKARLLKSDGQVVESVRLLYKGQLVALLNQPEVYAHRKQERIHRQFGYSDLRHPAIKLIHDSGDWLLGGELEVMDRIRFNDGLDEYRKTPKELRQHFQDAGCDCVFAFQLRNPIHNGHALLMQETRKELLKRYNNPMLLLHPLGGWTKDDDVPLAVRIQQHQAVLQAGVLDPKWTVLAIFPSPMLYAGPTEVQWHARARLACGIKAYIVGRDPAGIPDQTGDYLYDPSHGAKVLTMAPGLPNLEIIPFRVAAYDHKQQKMVFVEESRKTSSDYLYISGTKMRNYAKHGLCPPDGFMCPEAWGVLAKHYTKELPDADATKEEQ